MTVTVLVDIRPETNHSDEIVLLELSSGARRATMTARRDWTLEQLAKSILDQQFPQEADQGFRARLIIKAHKETGEEMDEIWVVDSVAAEQLPDELAQDGIDNMPGWSSWTADQAETWIDENVTDLESAKTVLCALSRMVVFLRDRYIEWHA